MWFKVDDKLWGHPKWLAVPARARGLWVTAGSWAAANETDGKVPRHVISTLGGNARDATSLCDAGLWREVKAGWIFHEWGVYQPDSASLKAKRNAEADGGALGNHRRWHMGRNITVPDCEYCQGMPPDDDVEPVSDYRVPDQGPEGVPESGANRPVPDPDPIPKSSSKVGGGGYVSSARVSEPPPPPTPEILQTLREPWRCPDHQGVDESCHHCKAYKAAHKALEAQRVAEAKARKLDAESQPRRDREAEAARTLAELEADPDAPQRGLNRAREALKAARSETKEGTT